MNDLIEMVMIPGGTFQMGAAKDEAGAIYDEYPQHGVTVSDFWMGKYPITQPQWRAVAEMPKVERGLNPNPAYHFKGYKNYPVEQVSWYEAEEFCKRLSIYTGRKYRLPSEAEWEYACRARTITPFHCGATITTDLANYRGVTDNEIWIHPGSYGRGPEGEYRQQTTEVGKFPANDFGLCDMHGNVSEWCLDNWHETYDGAPTDGTAWSGQGITRITRGGSWDNAPVNCRASYRGHEYVTDRNNDVGFRVVSQ